jgi:hypothetical protein
MRVGELRAFLAVEERPLHVPRRSEALAAEAQDGGVVDEAVEMATA